MDGKTFLGWEEIISLSKWFEKFRDYKLISNCNIKDQSREKHFLKKKSSLFGFVGILFHLESSLLSLCELLFYLLKLSGTLHLKGWNPFTW